MFKRTYDFQVDPGVPRRRLPEVHPAPVGASVVLAQVLDPEDGRGVAAGLEARPRPEVDAVIPVPADLHPVAADVEAAIKREREREVI